MGGGDFFSPLVWFLDSHENGLLNRPAMLAALSEIEGVRPGLLGDGTVSGEIGFDSCDVDLDIDGGLLLALDLTSFADGGLTEFDGLPLASSEINISQLQRY